MNPMTPSGTAWLKALLIAAVTVWIYAPALHGPLLADDVWYISTNVLLRDWLGLWRFWFEPGMWVEYYPVEETVLWLEWHLWGNDPLGYHVVNVLLHIVNALLFWRLLGKFGLRLAWLGALIFALHPVNVDSVAAVVELKNTLSLTPFLLAMCAWIDFDRDGLRRDYRWALGLFLAAMLCKISMMPFPAVILLHAWWKRGRVGLPDLKASAPFFFVSAILGPLTLWAGMRYVATATSHIDVVPMGGLLSRLAISGLNLSFYFFQVLVPWDSATFHSRWTIDPGRLVQLLPWPVFAVLVLWCWRHRTSWGRHALLGLGFFVAMIAPFLGFFPVSYMSFAWVFEHMLYIPSLGLIGLEIAALEKLDTNLRTPARAFTGVVVAIVLAWMAGASHRHARLYGDEEAYWHDALAHSPANWFAHHDLGCYYVAQQRYPEAIRELKETVREKPDFDQGHYNLGVALEQSGDVAGAMEQYREAIAINGKQTGAYVNLGEILRREGHLAESEAIFRSGLSNVPGDPPLSSNLGGLLLQSGRTGEAIAVYRQALERSADFPTVQFGLGAALLNSNDVVEAETHLRLAVALNPGYPEAHAQWGIALARLGRLPDAIAQFQAALRLDGPSIQTRDNLALALAQSGRIPEAMDQLRQVLASRPADATAGALLDKLQQASPSSNPTNSAP